MILKDGESKAKHIGFLVGPAVSERTVFDSEGKGVDVITVLQ